MNIVRIISFIGITLIALFLPLWVFICVVPVYAFVFSPYELLILSVCIDAQFGDVGREVWYAYTAVVSFVTILTMSIRPLLRFYAN